MLNPEEIQAYLDRKGVKEACLCCGYPDAVVDPDNLTVGLPGIADAALDLASVIPAISIICKRCGFVRLHAVDYLLGNLE